SRGRKERKTSVIPSLLRKAWTSPGLQSGFPRPRAGAPPLLRYTQPQTTLRAMRRLGAPEVTGFYVASVRLRGTDRPFARTACRAVAHFVAYRRRARAAAVDARSRDDRAVAVARHAGR